MLLQVATVSTFFSAYQQSDGFGKLIFWALFALSCVTWVVLLQKIWLFKSIRGVSSEFDHAFESRKESLLSISKESLPKLKDTPHPFGKLFFSLKQKTLEILSKNHTYGGREEEPVFLSSADMQLMHSHLNIAISKEIKSLEQNLFVLSTISTLAPFLGLLGTVWGILVSFGELKTGASAQSSSIILGGLSTALTTTVLGLLIAIPALIGYSYLKNAVKSLVTDMDHFCSNMLTTIELEYRKVDSN